MADSFTRSILMKDLVALQKKPLTFAWLPDDVLVDDDILNWQMYLLGPQETMYEGGVFKVVIKFPPSYPNEPPEMRFITPIWHPNVYADGRVCISILHKPGGTAEIPDDTPASECWRPILNIEAIVVSVLSMLSDPNFNSPANMDASARYLAPLSALKDLYSDVMYHSQVQMRNDIEGFKARVRSLVEDSRCEIACARKQMQGSAMDTAASGTASFSDRSIPGRCNLPVGFEFPSEHSASAGGTAGDDFDFVSDDDGVDEDQDDEEDAAGADGLTKKEQVIISEVCEMGFEREAVMAVVARLKERGKEISNDSVAEKLLDL